MDSIISGRWGGGGGGGGGGKGIPYKVIRCIYACPCLCCGSEDIYIYIQSSISATDCGYHAAQSVSYVGFP